MRYDCIIIGAGPAGIFAALELAGKDLKVLILEKGKGIDHRHCPRGTGPCRCCSSCSIMSGWGGAGAFSDGKLTLTTAFGGWLDQFIGTERLADLIERVDQVYSRFGAPGEVFGEYTERVELLEKKAAIANLKLVPARIRHLGTENNRGILERMRDTLRDQVEIREGVKVDEIVVREGTAAGVKVRGELIESQFIICAPGRDGAEWFRREAERLGLNLTNNPVDIGVRVEVPATTLEHLTKYVYEPKLVYYSNKFDDEVRTFCVNPYGEVVVENSNGLITVNGHSYYEKKMKNTNFALLVSKRFTEPFREPILYGKNVASLANMLSNGVIVQRLGDLRRGRRSTPERLRHGLVEPSLKAGTPGDLSLVLPYRHLVDITEMLEAMDKLAPGVASDSTLLYGVEVKFYSSRPELTPELETKVKNLFAIGDGAGITRGLAQASASGIVCSQSILERGGHFQ